MKKAYSKPEILFENFSLSTTIAAGCEVQTELPHWNQCGMDFSGLTVFIEGMTGCTDIQVGTPGGDGDYNGICYNVFSNGKNIFNS